MYDVLPLYQLMSPKSNHFAGRSGTGTMQIRKICLTAAMVAIVVSIATTISFLASISPPRDEMEAFDYPPEFFCASSENRIDYQTDGKCAAYAAAYLLRRFGEDTNGEALFPELKRTLGFVSANSVVDVFERYGYQAKACHGSVDTLKQRLTERNPIIVSSGFREIRTTLSLSAMTSSTFIWWILSRKMPTHRIRNTTGYCQRKILKLCGKQEHCFLTIFISLWKCEN